MEGRHLLHSSDYIQDTSNCPPLQYTDSITYSLNLIYRYKLQWTEIIYSVKPFPEGVQKTSKRLSIGNQ